MTRSVNNYALNGGLLKKDEENLQGDDVREGLTAVISVKVPEPQFEGQTKTKLGNSEVKGIVEALVNEKLAQLFERASERSQKNCRERRRSGARARGDAQSQRSWRAAKARSIRARCPENSPIARSEIRR